MQLDFCQKAALIAQYYCDNALIDYGMRKYSSSVVAWACICLAQDITYYGDAFHTNLWDLCPLDNDKAIIKKCGAELIELVMGERIQSSAIYKKFCQAQHDIIANRHRSRIQA